MKTHTKCVVLYNDAARRLKKIEENMKLVLFFFFSIKIFFNTIFHSLPDTKQNIMHLSMIFVVYKNR